LRVNSWVRRERELPLPGVGQIESNNYRVGKETFSLSIQVRFGGVKSEGVSWRHGGKCATISLYCPSPCGTSYPLSKWRDERKLSKVGRKREKERKEGGNRSQSKHQAFLYFSVFVDY
jgi:hypothetical protein